MIETRLKTDLVKVGDLLKYSNLTIPDYQRPYKWTTKHVNQLMDDIHLFRNKSAYRLGTIVIHEDESGKQNIVDGQQRTITLLLIAMAILDGKQLSDFKNKDLQKLLEALNSQLIKLKFSNEISISNIKDNYREIERKVAVMDEETILFLFTKCEFIQFVLSDISEAFQFFDSQNARGKDLEPHDLLKAYHLREFSFSEKADEVSVVGTWENMETPELSKLFGEYLFRIKGWSKGQSSRYFTKDEVGLFKGINMEKVENYPFAAMLRIAHHYIDHYNQSYERKIDQQKTDFPFQLDQPIINGKRFFELVSHYKAVFDILLKTIADEKGLDENARLIFKAIDNYGAKNRTGDAYVRNLFNCALLFYIDKFGHKELSKAIEKIFIWAYMVRMNFQAVQLASVDNYVLDNNLFRLIRESHHHSALLTTYLPTIKENASTKTEDILNLFKHFKYYEDHAQ